MNSILPMSILSVNTSTSAMNNARSSHAYGASGAFTRARRVLLVASVFSVAACAGGEESTTATVDTTATAIVLTSNDVAVATVGSISTGVLVTGSLEPAEQVTVTAQVAGTIGPMSVDRGSAVRRGQRLTTIQAQGVRSQAAGARANVAAAEAQLSVARIQRDGAKRLFDAGAISRVDYESALASYRAAEAQVAAAQAQAAAAGEAAGYTIVTAPLSGIVSERPAEPGQAIRTGDPILSIVNTSTLELAGRVPVDEAGAVRVGQPVIFSLDAFPGRSFRGSVARKDPAADPATRQVGVYVRLPNASGEITAGQYARGQVTGREISNAITIPVTAVQTTSTDSAVFIVENGKLARRVVTLGARDESTGRVVVTSGLAAGERVLLRPNPGLVAGQPVVISGDNTRGTSAAPSAAPASDATRSSASDTTRK